MSQAQMFLHLLGMGGTGKSTFMRLLEQLVGENNCEVTTMTALEGNTFETSSFLGKRLVAINDMEEWRGKVDTLKSLTGGDRIRCERKYKNKGRGFTYRGAVVILSNKNLNSTDKSSGLLRRRRTVVFDKVFTADEKVEFHLSGGEEQQLWSELPGLVNVLLDMNEKEAQQLLQTPPASVQEANNEANMQNNSVAAWLVENCKPAPGEKAHLGGRVEVTVIKAEGTTFSQRTSTKVFQNADTHLYPNYLTWCQARGVYVPQTHNNFSSNIRETLHSMGYGKNAAGRKGERDAAGMFIRNIALKEDEDTCGNAFLALPEWLK
jgi:putative DNA primase/helicase